jgi:hypothetical protein
MNDHTFFGRGSGFAIDTTQKEPILWNIFGQINRTKFSDKFFGQNFWTKFLTKFWDKIFGQKFRIKLKKCQLQVCKCWFSCLLGLLNPRIGLDNFLPKFLVSIFPENVSAEPDS